jgi:NitT/TauT family transport system permease protein
MALARKLLQAVALGLVALAALVAILDPGVLLKAGTLALLALYSTTRMFLAFVLSLVFAIAFGTAAATNKRLGEFLIPVLDVLQSVPILGFFPPALLFFYYSLNGSPVGVEIAIIFLIFTSMAWNIAFGVYEALTTLPHDLQEAATVFGVRDWLRFRRLFFPATIPRLVYNSMLSWTNGWFFLVASEYIASGPLTLVRPGLGSFIYTVGQEGDVGSLILGIGTLAVVVLLLDTFLWRPLSVWAERYRMEQTGGGEPTRPATTYERLRWLPRFPRVRRVLSAGLAPLIHEWNRAATPIDRYYVSHPRLVRSVRLADLAMFLVILVFVVLAGVIGLVGVFVSPLPPLAAEIPLAVLASLGRLALAYGAALAWTIPVTAFIVRNRRASRLITPILEVVASIPATALFPVILAFSVLLVGPFGLEAEFAAFLIALFAMQWYLLFNIIAGMRSIPGDMQEAAKAFGLRGWVYWKRVLLPAITPALLTGSITAWGAGWNALIVAEYISYSGTVYHVGAGIGYLVAYATYSGTDQSRLLLLAVLALIVVVLAMNKLLWRPILKRASLRYRIEIQ